MSVIERFLKEHWSEFLNHICKFSKMDEEFLTRFSYELDWDFVSENATLEWTNELINRFHHRWSWRRLCANRGIDWNTERIEKYRKYLDWGGLASNPALPLNDAFLQKHGKKFRNEWFTYLNPTLTDERIKQYGLKVWRPGATGDKPEEETIHWKADEQLFHLLKEHSLDTFPDQTFYAEVCVPVIESKGGIQRLFEERFDYRQQFYFLKHIKYDHHGLVPDFRLEGSNPFDDDSLRDHILELQETPVFVQGSLSEGPSRLYEALEADVMSPFIALILVSGQVKDTLLKFRLPKHSFTEVVLKPKKIKTNIRFFLLQVENNTLYKSLHYSSAGFNAITRSGLTDESSETYKGKIKDFTDLQAQALAHYHKLKQERDGFRDFNIEPERFILHNDFDLYTYQGDLIVNEFLKSELERDFPAQLRFESTQALRISQPDDIYESKRSRLLPDAQPAQAIRFEENEESRYFTEKKTRLEKQDPAFDFDRLAPQALAIERTLNVVLPDGLRMAFTSGKMRSMGELFTFLPHAEFYRQTAYQEKYPETYKAIVIAEDGGGDSLGLILEKEDDYRLATTLYYFNHESGEVEKFS